MKIAIDVMGSDHGSKYSIIAALDFIKEYNDIEQIYLVGKEEEIKGHLKDFLKSKPIPKQIIIHNAEDVIDMKASAIEGIRMPNSSMSKTVKLLKDKVVDGILSSGSTAAYLGICHLILKEIKGIKRPAFMPIMPTAVANKKVLLLDVGANVENTVDELISFALMANVYSTSILSVEKPKIALLNIGAESNKGTNLNKETFKNLTKLSSENEKLSFLNFYGNIEARYVLSGEADIIVCDGYSGNLVLKSVEGMASLIFSLMKKQYKKNLWNLLLGLMSKHIFKGIKKDFDYKNTGGAQLVGIDGICFKAHGSSDSQSYLSTLKLLRTAINQDVNNKIKESLSLLLDNKD